MEPIILIRDAKRRKNAIVPNFIDGRPSIPRPTLKLASLSVIQWAVYYMDKIIELPMEIIISIVKRTTMGWSLRQMVGYTPPIME
jgi:hypothetical protein